MIDDPKDEEKNGDVVEETPAEQPFQINLQALFITYKSCRFYDVPKVI